MEQNGNIAKEESFSQICRKIYAGVISVAVLAVLVIFPLYYRDYYFDMLQAKYQFYYITMIAMFGVVLLLSLAFLVVDALEFRLGHVKALFKRCSLKRPKDMWTVTELFLLVFLIVCVISTFQSDYFFEAFWGNEGRFTGLFLHLIYILGFFLVSRLYRFKEWHLYLFLAVGMLPLLFGITDYFYLDILDFKENIASKDIDAFTSTIGNINTYATLVGILFGVLSVLFVTEKRVWKTCLFFVGYMITIFAMIMANSDNGILAFGLIFAFLPLLALQSLPGIERYLWMLSGFFSSCYFISWINKTVAIPTIFLEGACGIMANLSIALPAAVLLGVLAAALHVYRWKCRKGKKEQLGKKYIKLWIGLLVICFCAGVFVLYDANGGGHSERYGSLGNYLHFSDEWGNYRGMIWKIAVEVYGKQPLSHKLWGYGLDTFGVMTQEYRSVTSQMNGQVYDSAHNEYLQYFVSVGPIGLFAYMGFLGTALLLLIRKAKDRQWGLAIAAGISCYLVQALVTINLPIVTPIMWMLLSVGVANTEKQEKLAKEVSSEMF